jgi:hypothetical protein
MYCLLETKPLSPFFQNISPILHQNADAPHPEKFSTMGVLNVIVSTLFAILLLSYQCDCTNVSKSSSFILNELMIDNSILNEDLRREERRGLRTAETSNHGCTISSCLGINVLSAITKDFKPWIDKGGITARDIDAAERKLVKVEGYIRVSILEGTGMQK